MRKIKMSDILKPGAELKAFKLSDSEVKEIVRNVEAKQSAIRKLKIIRPGDLDKIINL